MEEPSRAAITFAYLLLAVLVVNLAMQAVRICRLIIRPGDGSTFWGEDALTIVLCTWFTMGAVYDVTVPRWHWDDYLIVSIFMLNIVGASTAMILGRRQCDRSRQIAPPWK